MTWRRVPPVLSPVSPQALAAALAVVCRASSPNRDGVIVTLRKRYDALEVVLTDSGTSALTLALQAIIPRGGTVAYPSYGCVDLTTAAQGAGVAVRLYDLDPRTLSPDLDSVREVLQRGVDAIVVAHLFGYPADIGGVQRIAAEYGVPVIEDAAQSAGGMIAAKRLGSLADISVLSFGRGKGTTAGSGGAVLVRTPALTAWANRTRNDLGVGARGGKEVAVLTAQLLFSHPALYSIPASIPSLRLGEMVYHPPRRPRAMTATAATLLPAALDTDPSEVSRRRARAADILGRMGRGARLSPVHTIADGASGYLRLALLDVIGRVAPDSALGAVRGYPITLDQHEEMWSVLAPAERAGKGAAYLRDRLFTLPTHRRVSSTDFSRLMQWLGMPEPVAQTPLAPVHAS